MKKLRKVFDKVVEEPSSYMNFFFTILTFYID